MIKAMYYGSVAAFAMNIVMVVVLGLAGTAVIFGADSKWLSLAMTAVWMFMGANAIFLVISWLHRWSVRKRQSVVTEDSKAHNPDQHQGQQADIGHWRILRWEDGYVSLIDGANGHRSQGRSLTLEPWMAGVISDALMPSSAASTPTRVDCESTVRKPLGFTDVGQDFGGLTLGYWKDGWVSIMRTEPTTRTVVESVSMPASAGHPLAQQLADWGHSRDFSRQARTVFGRS